MCGVIGIYGNDDVFADLYQGLLAIQHRGQDSAGIITYDGRFHTKKGNGLVRDIFTADHAERLTRPRSASATPATRRSAAAGARTPSRSRSTRRSASSWPTTATW